MEEDAALASTKPSGVRRADGASRANCSGRRRRCGRRTRRRARRGCFGSYPVTTTMRACRPTAACRPDLDQGCRPPPASLGLVPRGSLSRWQLPLPEDRGRWLGLHEQCFRERRTGEGGMLARKGEGGAIVRERRRGCPAHDQGRTGRRSPSGQVRSRRTAYLALIERTVRNAHAGSPVGLRVSLFGPAVSRELAESGARIALDGLGVPRGSAQIPKT